MVWPDTKCFQVAIVDQERSATTDTNALSRIDPTVPDGCTVPRHDRRDAAGLHNALVADGSVRRQSHCFRRSISAEPSVIIAKRYVAGTREIRHPIACRLLRPESSRQHGHRADRCNEVTPSHGAARKRGSRIRALAADFSNGCGRPAIPTVHETRKHRISLHVIGRWHERASTKHSSAPRRRPRCLWERRRSTCRYRAGKGSRHKGRPTRAPCTWRAPARIS